uniref:Uncharacterized protein n=1 Tax=Clytia hemisphaerica TaxID=252671 RepID=A0A7M5XFG1_9CNID
KEIEGIQKRLKECFLLLEKEESEKNRRDKEEQQLGDQQDVLEEIDRNYIPQIEDLTKLCSKANQKIKKDAERIESLERTVHKQKKILELCNQFVSSYQKREQKLVNLVNGIDVYFENEMKKEKEVGCFRLSSKKSSNNSKILYYRDIVKELQELLVPEED